MPARCRRYAIYPAQAICESAASKQSAATCRAVVPHLRHPGASDGSAAHFRLRSLRRFGAEVTAVSQRVEKNLSDSLEFLGRGVLSRVRRNFRVLAAHNSVQADCDRLPEVHGRMLFTSRNVHQPMAMAEIFVRESRLFRAKQQGHWL